MTNKPVTNKNAATGSAATRRNFFLKAGTALSLPVAAGGASSLRPVDSVEDVQSLRRLQQALAREINNATGRAAALFTTRELPAGLDNVTRLLPADFGEHDAIEIAADGRTSHVTLRCTVETKTPIRAQGTLIEMARAQGEGFVGATSCRTLDMVCVREAGSWKIKALATRDS